jgi:hypothetical protein
MTWRRIGLVWVLGAGITLTTCLQAAAEGPGHSDTALFLAGMPVPAGSRLHDLAQASKQHASAFDAAFDALQQRQLDGVRRWSSAHLRPSRPTMFYFFSGPDFLYADAFFPDASTYVLSGLEAVGHVPDLTTLLPEIVAQTLADIESSFGSFFLAGYFITEKMDKELNKGPVNGVLPILYVLLARSGKDIRDVEFVDLDATGALRPGHAQGGKSAARGVKIVFAAPDGELKTLYYFSADIADKSNGSHAILQFCRQLGRGDSLLKSASYLLHGDRFAQVTKFLLGYSSVIVQDDSGIPFVDFDNRKWRLLAFGRYNRPYGVFEQYYQPGLDQLFQLQHSAPVDFAIGYQGRFDGSNVLLARRVGVAANTTSRDPRSVGMH